MAITFTKKQMQTIADVLDSDYDSVDDAAEAVVSAVVEAYEDRACWVVVGHLRWKPWRYDTPGMTPQKGEDGHWMDEQDWKDSRITIGPFITEKQAQDAREKLAISTATGEEFSTWVFPMWHDTPHAYFTTRKADKKLLDSLNDDSARARQVRAIERRTKWFETYGSDAELPHNIDDESIRCGKCGQVLPEEEE